MDHKLAIMLLLFYFLAFLWPFLEASLWWVAPDIIIGIAYVYFPKRWPIFLLLALVGALVGAVFTFVWASHAPEQWLTFVSKMPFHSEKNIQYVRHSMQSTSLGNSLAVVKGAWGGVPYKLFFGFAPSYGVPFWKMLLLGITSRGLRFSFTLWVTTQIRKFSQPWSGQNPGKLTALLLVIWAIMLLFFDLVVNRYFV